MPMLLAVITLLLMGWLAISIMWLLIRHEREAVKRVGKRQIRSDQIRSGQVRTGQDRSDQIRSGHSLISDFITV